MTLLARLSSQHFFRLVKRLLFFPGEGWLVENVYEKKKKVSCHLSGVGLKLAFVCFLLEWGETHSVALADFI